jgi:feruloyl-CoA synthase
VARALVMAEPPSIDANEITDKGYINQGAVLARRSALVEVLYTGGIDVIADRDVWRPESGHARSRR